MHGLSQVPVHVQRRRTVSDPAADERERCLAILRAYEDMFAKRGRSIAHDAAQARGMADDLFNVAEAVRSGKSADEVRAGLCKRDRSG